MGPYASPECFGSDGATFTKPVFGNDDIRDFLAGSFTNSINGVTTIQVFTAGSGHQNEVRLDMQIIELPAEFLTRTLTNMRVIDSGGATLQRIWLAGLTCETGSCPPDLNGDGVVTSQDSILFLNASVAGR